MNIFRKPTEEAIASMLKHKHPEAGKYPKELDIALVGVTSDGRLVYSENRILLAYQEEMGLEFEDAINAYETLSLSKDLGGRRPPVVIVHEP